MRDESMNQRMTKTDGQNHARTESWGFLILFRSNAG